MDRALALGLEAGRVRVAAAALDGPLSKALSDLARRYEAESRGRLARLARGAAGPEPIKNLAPRQALSKPRA